MLDFGHEQSNSPPLGVIHGQDKCKLLLVGFGESVEGGTTNLWRMQLCMCTEEDRDGSYCCDKKVCRMVIILITPQYTSYRNKRRLRRGSTIASDMLAAARNVRARPEAKTARRRCY